MQKTDRIQWIDMAKGWGMLLIILGHMGIDFNTDLRLVQLWVYTFHIPLFFFLSGYLFSADLKPLAFCKKKLRTILLPYFSLSVIILAFEIYLALWKGYFSGGWLWGMLKCILLQRRFRAIWFLACLFVVNILAYVLVRLIKKRWAVMIAAAAMALIAMLYYRLGGVQLYWNVDVAFAAMPFFLGGWMLKCHSERIDALLRKKKTAIIAFAGAVTIHLGAGFINYRLIRVIPDMFAMRYGVFPLMYLSAFGGIAATCIFSRWLTFMPVRFIGQNSLVIFGLHQTVFLPVVNQMLENVGFTIYIGDPLLKMLAFWATKYILVLLFSCAAAIVINRSPLKYLMGKRFVRPIKQKSPPQ